MNFPDATADDLLVSAVLDGVASPDDAARVAGDPALAARLSQFRAAARAVGGPVPLVDPVVRDVHLARALAEAVAPKAPLIADAPPLPTPPPPPLSDLAAARSRRHRRVAPAILSVAAALVLVVAVGALLVRQDDSTDSSSSDEVATATAPNAAESNEGGADAADAEQSAAGTPSTLATDGSATSVAADVDPTLPSLGTFTKAGDLAARVQGDLVVDANPPQRATDEACLDDFGTDVVLLGRATVGGDEGLVYVESSPGPARRLWFVDPTALAADGTCRQIVPVQLL